ncbi:Saposin A-type domain-containing protein [Aphelenchoides besseyi]|nr:Saposin A-type domain-containing protein [Aphelenchoides besseyi]
MTLQCNWPRRSQWAISNQTMRFDHLERSLTMLLVVLLPVFAFAQDYQHRQPHTSTQHTQYQNHYQQPNTRNNAAYYRTNSVANYHNASNYYYTHQATTQRTPTVAQQRPSTYNNNRYPPSPRPTPPSTPSPYETCNVPSDYWCDSHEIAARCGVTQQCEQFKRDRSPIIVTLMYEALCPFCQRFISNHLGNLHDMFRGKIEIELVPFGNSRLLSNGQISCNHGATECDANRLMSCVLDNVPMKQAIPFIVCFERQLSTYPQVQQSLHHCSSFIRNTYRQIRECWEGERGRQLQRQAAYRTMKIRAHPINEVPYIVINNYSPSNDANGINIMSLQHLLQKWINIKH